MDRDLNESFVGNVDSLYRDKNNHNVKIGVLSNGYKYKIPPLWELRIEIGDSLSKRKGSLDLYIYKKKMELIILDYRDIYKKK